MSFSFSLDSSAAFCLFGVSAHAEAFGDFLPHLHEVRGAVSAQVLRVGIDGDKVHVFQPGVYHVVDGVSAAAAHADDFDFGLLGFKQVGRHK